MPPSIADICRQHLDFMKWADEALLAAVAEHTPDRIGVMQHIYLGELVWYRRVRGEQNAQLADIEPPADVTALQIQLAAPASRLDPPGRIHNRLGGHRAASQ